MKKLNKYLMLFVAAFALVGCVDDVTETPSMEAQAGDEVQFGLSLPSSRTFYGPEYDETVNGNRVHNYPIYWEQGDKILIFSPDCLQGRNGAGYTVTPDSDNPNFASSLTKVEDYGVQWGEAEKASFYSLYPYGKYAMDDAKNPTKVTGVFVNYSQNIEVDGDNIQSDMEDCLLFASKKDVARGSIVELNYEPITTTFMVTLSVNKDSVEDFMIQSVQIQAPTGTYIAGKFNLNLDGTFEDWYDDASKSNTVSAAISDVNTGGFHTIANGETLTIPMFLAPVGELNTKGWKFIVKTPTKTFTKTISEADAKAVKPGMVHKISLPELNVTKVTEWDPATWMVNIPRNVYLSEISIPGTWNSLNPDCQSDTSIDNQYKSGVRAFHIDARWRAKYTNSDWIDLSKKENEFSDFKLSVANGGTSYEVGNLIESISEIPRVMDENTPTFESYLSQIVKNVKSDEYMVVFCTFAQSSYNNVDRIGKTWAQAVNEACDIINNSTDASLSGKIYNASNLTANTLVGDVLGKVIVIVNLDSTVAAATLPTTSSCLYTYVPMSLPSTHYDAGTSHIDALYYTSKTASGVSMYTSHAQMSSSGTSATNCGERGYSHPITKRDALVESIWNESQKNYGTTDYNHDKWIYLGLGGNISTSSNGKGDTYDQVENRYAPMIYNRIDAMGKNNVSYYPVGIILMNNKKGSKYTTTSGNTTTELDYDFAGVCKQILLLNNKYRLQYDSSKPVDYNPNAKAKSAYDGTLTTGGNAY